MPAVSHSAALWGALTQAHRRAAERQEPVLLRLHLRLGPADPWALWQAAMPKGALRQRSYVAIHDGIDGLCAAGWGAVRHLRLRRAGRFAAVRRTCSGLLEQCFDVPLCPGIPVDGDAPLAFCGFAFAAKGSPEPWAAWGSGQLLVPRTLVYHRRAADPGAPPPVCRAILTQRVDGAAALAGLHHRLLRQLQRLRRLARRAPPAGAVGEPAALQVDPADEAAAAWQARVRAAAAAAAAGRFAKVVLARGVQLGAPAGTTFAPLATAWALRRAQPQSICFVVGTPGGGTFLGASPEHLVRVSGRQVRTQAVAGTAPRHPAAAEDAALGAALLQSDKDGQEHAVVVQSLRAALAPLCAALGPAAPPRLLKLPRLQHLETPIAGIMRQAGGILELVERLHPSPAVGGWPRAAALEYLDQHEPLSRGHYAGPVGWLTAASDGAFAVAIRSVLLQGAAAHAYAGAGIVAASDAAAEWAETELKLRTVCDALRVTPLASA